MNKLRTLTIFMAIVSLIFFVCTSWFDINIPQEVKDICQLVAGVLIALGILVDTGATPQPLSKETFIEKLKSPLAISSIFALLSYIVYLRLAPEQADALLKIIDTIIVGIFSISVYNNPNARQSIR